MTVLERLSSEWESAQARANVVRDVFYAMKHRGRDAALQVLSSFEAIYLLSDDEINNLSAIIRKEVEE